MSECVGHAGTGYTRLSGPDALGHAPADTLGGPGPQTAATIAMLQGDGITVLAFDMAGLESDGNATAITSATGGTL